MTAVRYTVEVYSSTGNTRVIDCGSREADTLAIRESLRPSIQRADVRCNGHFLTRYRGGVRTRGASDQTNP